MPQVQVTAIQTTGTFSTTGLPTDLQTLAFKRSVVNASELLWFFYSVVIQLKMLRYNNFRF